MLTRIARLVPCVLLLVLELFVVVPGQSAGACTVIPVACTPTQQPNTPTGGGTAQPPYPARSEGHCAVSAAGGPTYLIQGGQRHPFPDDATVKASCPGGPEPWYDPDMQKVPIGSAVPSVRSGGGQQGGGGNIGGSTQCSLNSTFTAAACTQTCPNGSVILGSQSCPQQPQTPERLCQNGSAGLLGLSCPGQNQTCPDGSVIPISQSCPQAPTTTRCLDGSYVRAGQSCPQQPPQTCPYGTTYDSTDGICHPPSNLTATRFAGTAQNGTTGAPLTVTSIQGTINGNVCGVSSSDSQGNYYLDVSSSSGCNQPGGTLLFTTQGTQARGYGTIPTNVGTFIILNLTFDLQQPPPQNPGHLQVIWGLTLSSNIPIVDRQVSAGFTIKNDGGQPITIDDLTAAARKGSDWGGTIVDFPDTGSLTLQPGAEYDYRGMRSFPEVGNYFAEPTVELNGTWGGIDNANRDHFTVMRDRPPPDSPSVLIGSCAQSSTVFANGVQIYQAPLNHDLLNLTAQVSASGFGNFTTGNPRVQIIKKGLIFHSSVPFYGQQATYSVDDRLGSFFGASGTTTFTGYFFIHDLDTIRTVDDPDIWVSISSDDRNDSDTCHVKWDLDKFMPIDN